MNTINEYLKSIGRRYPATQAVREQIEELRDTLHLKTEELQAQGKPYEQAEREAIDSIGDISPLMSEVAGNVRTVYVNHLDFKFAILMFHLFIAEFLAVWFIMQFSWSGPARAEFIVSFIVLIIGAGVWPLRAHTKWKRDIGKTQTIATEYKKQMRRAVSMWLLILVASFMLGIILHTFTPSLIIITATANWPFGVYAYHKKFISGRYDAQG